VPKKTQNKKARERAATQDFTSWGAFQNAVREFISEGHYLFRGQSNPDWFLSSHLDRMGQETPGFSQTQMRDWGRELSSMFKHEAEVHINTGLEQISNEFELLAVGRHHGLRAPLLDWSDSPYVAAFFAFSDLVEGAALASSDGWEEWSSKITDDDRWICVWALEYTQGDELDDEDDFFFFRPWGRQHHRLRAQRGSFTVLQHDQHSDLEAYLESRGALARLSRLRIAANLAAEALDDLKSMNIRPSTLYQDLEGAAWEANLMADRDIVAGALWN
jgi:hypothetical protein